MRKSTIVKGILLTLVVGGVIVAPGAIIPIAALAKLLQEARNAPIPVYIPEESNPETVRQSLYRLRKNEYIKTKALGKNKFKFELTKKGRKLLSQYTFFDFKIKSKGPWDGQWRMVIFDIPEKQKLVRDALRKKLKQIGFFRFQKSVWVYPHECMKEMNYVCEFLGTEQYTTIFTGKIQNDRLLRKYFLREGMLNKSELKAS